MVSMGEAFFIDTISVVLFTLNDNIVQQVVMETTLYYLRAAELEDRHKITTDLACSQRW